MFFMFLNFKTMPQMAGIERDVEVARLKFRSHCRERPYTRCRPFGLISSAVSSRTQRTHRAQRNVRKQLAVLAARALRWLETAHYITGIQSYLKECQQIQYEMLLT